MPSWGERKRRSNLALHGLDFADSDAIRDDFTVTREDRRAKYGEAPALSRSAGWAG